MTTAAQLIGRLQSQVNDRPTRDTLAGAVDADDTSFTLTSGEKIAVGDIAAVELELVYISAKPTTETATVVRGYQATTADSHPSATEVLQSFRHSPVEYLRALNKALVSIGQMIPRQRWDDTQSFATGARVLSVPAGATGVFAVLNKSTDYNDALPIGYTYSSQFPAALSSTGKGVYLYGAYPTTGTAYVGYTSEWSPLALLSDTLDDEFSTALETLLLLGAEAYLADTELFERTAFHGPHVDLRTAAETNDVRMMHNTVLLRFLQERAEMAGRYAPAKNFAWMRG